MSHQQKENSFWIKLNRVRAQQQYSFLYCSVTDTSHSIHQRQIRVHTVEILCSHTFTVPDHHFDYDNFSFLCSLTKRSPQSPFQFVLAHELYKKRNPAFEEGCTRCTSVATRCRQDTRWECHNDVQHDATRCSNVWICESKALALLVAQLRSRVDLLIGFSDEFIWIVLVYLF